MHLATFCKQPHITQIGHVTHPVSMLHLTPGDTVLQHPHQTNPPRSKTVSFPYVHTIPRSKNPFQIPLCQLSWIWEQWTPLAASPSSLAACHRPSLSFLILITCHCPCRGALMPGLRPRLRIHWVSLFTALLEER